MPRKGMRTIFSSSPSSHSSQPTPNYTFLSPIMDQHIEKAESVIKKWDLEENSTSYCRIDTLFTGDRSEAKIFLKSVSKLQSAIEFISSKDPNSDKLKRAQNLMGIAIKRLQEEFYRILSKNQASLDTKSETSSTSDSDDVAKDETAIFDLRSIVEAMISCGYRKECVNIYKKVRKIIVNESLYHLGVERLIKPSQMQKMDWKEIEIKINLWLNALEPAVTLLFQGEKIMCEHVFFAYPTIPKSCFAHIVSDGAMILFEFPENVAKYKKLTLEKIFQVLDLHKALSELLPEIESVFSYKPLSNVISQATNSLTTLSKAIRYMLSDFEAAIHKHLSKSPLPGGGVHPLTRYVMNYIIVLTDYIGTLCDIFADSPASVQSPMPESYFYSPVSGDGPDNLDHRQISTKFAWIILLLLCKLDVKASLYSDVALSYLFLGNNLNYVVSKVRSSKLKILLGDEWLENHEKKGKQYAESYERIGWSKVMSSLINPTDETSREELRECIRKFSKAFEEAYRKQRSWVVPERKLRDEIRVSIAKRIGPPYRAVCKAYRLKMEGRIGIESYVRYAPDNLGNYLSDLFYGTGSL